MAPKHSAPVSDEEPDYPAFKAETIHEIFRTVWASHSTRATPTALHLSAEYLRLFAVEAIHRTGHLAKAEANKEADMSHLSAIAPSLVADF